MQMIENFDFNTLVPLLLDVAGAIVLLIITFVVAGWAKRATRRSMEASELGATLRQFFSSLARYTVLILGGLAVLGVFGVSVASFAAILAAGGFAVGMALQGTLAHFAAGVMLLIFRPFTVGDKVSAADVTGTVVEVGLFSTLFDTPDNRRLIVPNGAIYGSTIENINHHDTRRVGISVGTEYDADLDTARSVLEHAAASIEGGLSDPAPQVYLSELGGSSINWSVRVWAKTSDYWAVKERLTNAVKQALDEHEIGMPYPQMDVHLDELASTDGQEDVTPRDSDPASSA